jgi:hypothetical protein
MAKKKGSFRALSSSRYGPVSGTTSTRRHVDDDRSVPVPTMLIESVVDVPQPVDSVLLPLSPGAALTIVRAGALPVPVQVRLTDT